MTSLAFTYSGHLSSRNLSSLRSRLRGAPSPVKAGHLFLGPGDRGSTVRECGSVAFDFNRIGAYPHSLDERPGDLLPGCPFSSKKALANHATEPLDCIRRNATGPTLDLLAKRSERLVHAIDFAAEPFQPICDIGVAC